jgi:hypothetical protein
MRAKTCIDGSNPSVSATLHNASYGRVMQGALRSAKREGGLHNSRNLLHLAAGTFAPRTPFTRLPYGSALRLFPDKRAQQEPALCRHHNRSETAFCRTQFRQVTAHGRVQTVAPRHLCCLLRCPKSSQIRALSEIRLRPRLCESTSVVALPQVRATAVGWPRQASKRQPRSRRRITRCGPQRGRGRAAPSRPQPRSDRRARPPGRPRLLR